MGGQRACVTVCALALALALALPAAAWPSPSASASSVREVCTPSASALYAALRAAGVSARDVALRDGCVALRVDDASAADDNSASSVPLGASTVRAAHLAAVSEAVARDADAVRAEQEAAAARAAAGLVDYAFRDAYGVAQANWTTYGDYALLTAFLRNVTQHCRARSTMFTIGASVQGRELWTVRMVQENERTEAAAAADAHMRHRPEFKYVANIHGNEVVGRECIIRFYALLCEQYGVDPVITELLDTTDITIIPSMNPDGFALGTRRNANGFDLNRGFPDRLRDPVNTVTGRQPEVVHVMQYMPTRNILMSATLHGGALVVNYPYDGNEQDEGGVYTECPDDSLFVQISLNYSMVHPTMHESERFVDGITNGAAWWCIYGGMQDWHYVWAGSYEVTLELTEEYWPPADTIPGFWAENINPLRTFMAQIHCGVRGRVLTEDGDPVACTVRPTSSPHFVRCDPTTGDYVLPLPMGTHELEFGVANDPYAGVVTTVNVPDRTRDCRADTATRLDITLPTTPMWPTLVAIGVGALVGVTIAVIVTVLCVRRFCSRSGRCCKCAPRSARASDGSSSKPASRPTPTTEMERLDDEA